MRFLFSSIGIIVADYGRLPRLRVRIWRNVGRLVAATGLSLQDRYFGVIVVASSFGVGEFVVVHAHVAEH